MVEQKFELIKIIGDGAFGQVFLAKERNTNEIVAIKKMKRKYLSWEDAMALPEIKCLL